MDIIDLKNHICFDCKHCFSSSSESDPYGMGGFINYFCSKYDCSADPFPEIIEVCESFTKIKI